MTPPVLVVVKVTPEAFSPLHDQPGSLEDQLLLSLTVIVNVLRRSIAHLASIAEVRGDNDCYFTTSAVPGLVATNEGISPLPVAGNPIVG